MNRDTPEAFQLFFILHPYLFIFRSVLVVHFSFPRYSSEFLTIFFSFSLSLSLLSLNTVALSSLSTIISTGINEHTASHCFDIPHTGFHSLASTPLVSSFPFSLLPPFLTSLAHFSFYFPARSTLPFLSLVAQQFQFRASDFFLRSWSVDLQQRQSEHRLIIMTIIRLIKPRLLICLSNHLYGARVSSFLIFHFRPINPAILHRRPPASLAHLDSPPPVNPALYPVIKLLPLSLPPPLFPTALFLSSPSLLSGR